jgi:hypothetical protein
MANTALDIIKDAYDLINIISPGEEPDADDVQRSLKALNSIIDSWNNQRLMLYSIKNVTGNLTANKIPHTIGATGADITLDRPLRIEKAFVRVAGLTNPIDYPLTQDDNNRYQEYTIKLTKVSYPTNFYYEPTYPLASIYLYPVQGQALELHMSVWMQLTEFAALTTEAVLPMAYEAALKYKLAVDLAPRYGKINIVRGHPVYDRCHELVREIKAVNQPKYVSTIDAAILGNRLGNNAFNIYRGY